MQLLLDTHAFLWLLSNPSKLSKRALDSCQDPDNILFLSVVSAWEIQIKQRLGKLAIEVPLEEAIRQQRADNALQILPVELRHVMALGDLPDHHGDPFDRLLIAQATTEGQTLVTSDSSIQEYSRRDIVLVRCMTPRSHSSRDRSRHTKSLCNHFGQYRLPSNSMYICISSKTKIQPKTTHASRNAPSIGNETLRLRRTN